MLKSDIAFLKSSTLLIASGSRLLQSRKDDFEGVNLCPGFVVPLTRHFFVAVGELFHFAHCESPGCWRRPHR